MSAALIIFTIINLTDTRVSISSVGHSSPWECSRKQDAFPAFSDSLVTENDKEAVERVVYIRIEYRGQASNPGGVGQSGRTSCSKRTGKR